MKLFACNALDYPLNFQHYCVMRVKSANWIGILEGTSTNMKKFMRAGMVLLMASLIVFAGAGCTAKAKLSYHLSRADRYFNAGQYGQAEIEYLNVLRLDHNNPQAYTRLGLLYYEQGRFQRATFFLSKAVPLAPDNLEARDKLAFIYSSVGEYSNALAQVNYVLNKDPRDDDATLILPEVSVKPSDADATRQRLLAMSRNGDRAAIEVALGNLAMHDHDLATASAAFKKAQALDPKSSVVNVGLGTVAWAQDDLKQADAYFKAASDSSPMRSPRRMQYVRFKVQTGDIAGARALLGEIIKGAPDYVPAARALAELAVLEKKYDEGAEILANVLKLDPDNFDALNFQAQLERARGNLDQAVVDFERISRLFSDIPQVYYQLGAVYLATGDLNKAAANFNRALELNPKFDEAALMLAQVQIKSGNANIAVASLEKMEKRQPKWTQLQLVLANAYEAQGRPGDALAIYENLESMYPTNLEILMMHGVALTRMQDKEGERKVYEKALQIAPENLVVLEQLVNLDVSDKKFDVATGLVNRELQKYPNQPVLQFLSAAVLVAEGKQVEAQASLLKILQQNPTNADAGILLAQSYAAAGQNDKAIAQLDTVLDKDSGNASALLQVALAYSSLKENKKAADAYERLLKIDPRNSAALNNLAYIYNEYLNNLDRAYELAQQARQLLPNDPATADTLGWASFKRGSYDTALNLLKESVSHLSDPEIQFHYGMVCYMTGDELNARTALQRAWQSGANFPERDDCQTCLSILNVDPATADAATRAMLEKRVAVKADDPFAQSRLARIYVREGNSTKAISMYEAILQTSPNNLDAMINLIHLYPATDTKKAYDMAKAAYKIAPYNADISQSLGHLALLSGDYQLAANVLQQAVRSQTDKGPLFFDCAQATYSVGRISAAQSALQSALGLSLPAAQAAQAKQMLDMINLSLAPAQAAASRARIDEVLKSDPNNVPALVARAASNEAKADFSAAEQDYEMALGRYPDFTPAQLRLAALYTTDPAKLDRAYALATKARDAMPDDPSVAKILGIILVQRSDYSHAVNLLKQSALKLTSDAEVFYYLGAAQYHLNNRTESKSSLQQALALNLSNQLADSAKQMLSGLK